MAHLILQLGTAPVVPFLAARHCAGKTIWRSKRNAFHRRLRRVEDNWCALTCRAAARTRRMHTMDDVDAFECLTVAPALLAFASHQPQHAARAMADSAGQ